MPTYEYACKKCGERFEIVQSFKDKTLRTHPGCGGDVQKVFHPAGIIFKGSGFYVTDSKSSSSKSGSSKSSGSKLSESKSSEFKSSESKSSESKSSESKSSKSKSSSSKGDD